MTNIKSILDNEDSSISDESKQISLKKNKNKYILTNKVKSAKKFKDYKNSNSYLKRDKTELNLINYCIKKFWNLTGKTLMRGFPD